jgi:polysaccharide export outer membrane protein
MIAYPLLGQVGAATKTTGDIRDEITNRLGAQYLRNPKVSVEVANHRPVYVLGEVARPGEFAYVEGLTAFALVAKAGGFTYRANQKIIFIRHEANPSEQAYSLTVNVTIRPGDTVRIGERYF